MKRKMVRPIVRIDGRVTVVHFNVGSGYVTYIEQPEGAEKPQLYGVLLAKPR